MSSSRPTPGIAAAPNAADGTPFVLPACSSYLLEAQNEDGGWGFSRGLESRVEPTSWALLALTEISAGGSCAESISRGYKFLERAQLADGSWPAASGQGTGSWVTSLACWALRSRSDVSPRLARGVRWLEGDVPGDARFWGRFIRGVVALTSDKRVNAQNQAYWGWSWTAGTASWVEPTAQALIVLGMTPVESSSRDARQRRDVAEKMLYDRMCPGGGWNCGNPRVYGVPGEPLVGPTVWALLALRAHPRRQENQISLDWLAQNWMKIESPGSLALAQIGLQAYGKRISGIRVALAELYARGEFAWTVPVAAWTALAMSEKTSWLNPAMPPKTS
jgi:Squalene-hopene cyclase C-terminal domain